MLWEQDKEQKRCPCGQSRLSEGRRQPRSLDKVWAFSKDSGMFLLGAYASGHKPGCPLAVRKSPASFYPSATAFGERDLPSTAGPTRLSHSASRRTPGEGGGGETVCDLLLIPSLKTHLQKGVKN